MVKKVKSQKPTATKEETDGKTHKGSKHVEEINEDDHIEDQQESETIK
jgi:hypothetical protein